MAGAIPARVRSPARLTVLVGATALFALWMLLHLGLLTATQNGWIRFVITLGFSLLILLRPKPARSGNAPDYPGAHEPVLVAVPGTAFVLVGLIFGVQQFEWIGILMVLWGCLRWSLPQDYGRDLSLALLLLYWSHPLPARIFGPLQLGMQHLSVRGAEALLLGLDVRVWADGLVLRTGFSIYEIPEWCSGMRTATTVFLLAWGLCILNRFRAWPSALLILAALAQAAVLNILRIATLVILVPRLVDRSQAEYLHNAGGALAILAVFLVYAEILLVRRLRQRAKLPAPAPDLDRQIEHPPDWLHLRSVRWAVILGGVTVAFLTLAVYRNTPERRLAVLKDVAQAAQDAETHEEGLLLALAVNARDPSDMEWQLKSLRLLLAMQRHAEVLVRADALTGLEGNQAQERNVLRAYSLMALERVEEADAIVRALPESTRRANPRVAMILAVVAFRAGDADRVAEHLVLAARWRPNLSRIRLMYPFLRQHRKWDAIAGTDAPEPYSLPEPAFAAIEAFMNLDRTPEVARLTLEALQHWPADTRVLEPLFYMSVKRAESEWEARFAAHLRRCASGMQSVDSLYALLDKCVELGRPDLAWHLYRRMQALDPTHPALSMTLVRYGDQWFAFRRRTLGMPSPTPLNTVDLRPYFLAARYFSGWRSVRAAVPEGEAFAVSDTVPMRRRNLDLALAAFETHRAHGALSLPMLYLQAYAFEMAGRTAESRKALQEIARRFPEEALAVRIALSESYERARDSQGVYETLRTLPEMGDPPLPALLRLGRAELDLNLNLAALHTARLIDRLYPRSALGDALLATALMQNAGADEALELLKTPRQRHIRELDVLRARALFQTERFHEAETFCHAALLALPPVHADTPQHFVLPPAEMATLWHQYTLPTDDQFARNLAVLRQNQATATSPFLQQLLKAWITCYESGAQGDTADPDWWKYVGRDALEHAVALNQLTALLCHAGHFEKARAVALDAAERLPSSAPLWRWAISLSGADTGVVARARAACPNDPEIWLAELTTTVNANPSNAMAVVQARLADPALLPPETLARAGEFLQRRGRLDEAALVLQDAAARSGGLMPVYLLGLRCALARHDATWATDCARQAILAALRPPKALYRKLVDLKSAGSEPATDFDMVEALKSLRSTEPENMIWAQLLGYVRFKRGGWEILDAYTQMDAAISGGVTNALTFKIAAETSRLMGNDTRSVEILRQGLRFHPTDMEMLNNLAYVLTEAPDGLAEAQALLPRLIEIGADDPHVLDTIAAIHVKAGETDKARTVLQRLLARTSEGSNLWFRAQMHTADLEAHTGDVARAIQDLSDALNRSQGVPDEDVVTANRKIARWRNQVADIQAAERPVRSTAYTGQDSAPPTNGETEVEAFLNALSNRLSVTAAPGADDETVIEQPEIDQAPTPRMR